MSAAKKTSGSHNDERLPQPNSTTLKAVRLLLTAGTSGNGRYLVTVRGKQIIRIEQVEGLVIENDPLTYQDAPDDVPGV